MPHVPLASVATVVTPSMGRSGGGEALEVFVDLTLLSVSSSMEVLVILESVLSVFLLESILLKL